MSPKDLAAMHQQWANSGAKAKALDLSLSRRPELNPYPGGGSFRCRRCRRWKVRSETEAGLHDYCDNCLGKD